MHGSHGAGAGVAQRPAERSTGTACYICLEVHADSPLLARVCACVETRVHESCLQDFLNSEGRRALAGTERTRCPICCEQYRLHLASKAHDRVPMPPCWALVRKRNLAVGVALLAALVVLVATLASRISVVTSALLGMALASTGCLVTLWATVLPQLEASDPAECDAAVLVVVRGAPQAAEEPPAAEQPAGGCGGARAAAGATRVERGSDEPTASSTRAGDVPRAARGGAALSDGAKLPAEPGPPHARACAEPRTEGLHVAAAAAAAATDGREGGEEPS
ncbi:hypothetical protein KFE25_004564 [Diacronema lutheri]|uniref:RING-CH-type domain-containing protein n=1 Tax=Diacronema lutheri TaxID=2081491 RepID=A0A8J6C8F2_DIALT|nr:hypothetical protein KFE25_004564 [Diacronema lutheri]